MATRYAVATGNWSDTATWDGGTLPGPGDLVYSNNKIVTIDQNIDVGELRQKSGSGITAGGYFQVTSGTRTITANLVEPGDNAGNRLLLVTGSGTVVTLNGNLTGGTDNFDIALQISSSANVTVNGNVTGGSAGNQSHGIELSSGTLTVNGDVTGGSSSVRTSFGINAPGGGVVTVNGDVKASTGVTYPAPAIVSTWTSPPRLKVTGRVVFGLNSSGSVAVPAITGTAWAGEPTSIMHVPVLSGSNWNGTPIELDAGGGEPVDPKRFLNVGGEAVPIQ